MGHAFAAWVLAQLLPEEFSQLQQHAMSDLKLFLELRAKEFRPGGMLVLGYPSTLCGPDNQPQ